MKGKLIVVEGGEGSGKSTLVKQLADKFTWKATREPGGTKLAESVREILMNNQIPDLRHNCYCF